MQLTIVSVPVSDQETSKAFYRDVLGFKVVREAEMSPKQRWVQMKPPSGSAGIALVDWFEAMKPGSLQGLVLETMDIEHMHDKLKEAGLAISDVQTAHWGRFATFADPDGNGWVLAMPSLA